MAQITTPKIDTKNFLTADEGYKLVTSDDLVVFMVRNWSDILKSILKKNRYMTNWVYMRPVYLYHLTKWVSYDPESLDAFLKHVDIESY